MKRRLLQSGSQTNTQTESVHKSCKYLEDHKKRQYIQISQEQTPLLVAVVEDGVTHGSPPARIGATEPPLADVTRKLGRHLHGSPGGESVIVLASKQIRSPIGPCNGGVDLRWNARGGALE